MQQVSGGLHRLFAPAEEQVPVLPVQCGAPGLRDQVVNRAAQQRLPEAEHVPDGGHDPGGHRLLDDRQERGRAFADHLGRVFVPEGGAEDRGRHQQVLRWLAQAVEPLARHPVYALRQSARRKDGSAPLGSDGVIVAQAGDQRD